MSDNEYDRTTYTWGNATRDLALGTRLLLGEAATVVSILEETDVHPYDAVPHLVKLFGEGPLTTTKARALKALIEREADDGG